MTIKNLNKTSYDFSIIVPCYNSEGSIQILLDEISTSTENLKNFTLREIICINDNSEDDTLKILYKMKESLEILKIINNTSNLGQVKSTLLGIEKSLGNYIVTIDDDLQHPPKEIPKLLKFCHENKFDFVTGYWKNDESYLRNITSVIANFIINLLALQGFKYRITAFRVIKFTLKEEILSCFKKNSLMDLRKITKNYGYLQIEHKSSPLNREYSKFSTRFKITLQYIFIDNLIAIFTLLSIFTILIISIFL